MHKNDRFDFKIWSGIDGRNYEENAIDVLKDWTAYCNDTTGYKILREAIKMAIQCMEENKEE